MSWIHLTWRARVLGESMQGVAPDALYQVERVLERDARVYMSPTVRQQGDVVIFEMWFGASAWTEHVHRQVRLMLRDAFRRCAVGDPLLPEGSTRPVMKLMLEEFPLVSLRQAAG